LSTWLVPFFPTYLSVRTFACAPHCVARMRPALCGPHASQPPATSLVLALALAPAPVRPARPSSGAGCVPSVCADFPESAVRAHAIPACRPAARQPAAFPPVSPERGGAFCLPCPNNDDTRRRWHVPKRRRGSSPRRRPGATVGRCLPAVRACQVWGLGVQHRRRSLDDCPPFLLKIWGWDSASVFFGSAKTLPLVVLRN
jgi:hypothetical protein